GYPVESIQSHLNRDVSVTGPSVFLALRAIGWIAMQIGQIGAPCCLPDLINYWIRRFDGSRLWHVAVHEQSGKAGLGQRNGNATTDLDKLESLVVESWRERLPSLAFQDEGV